MLSLQLVVLFGDKAVESCSLAEEVCIREHSLRVHSLAQLLSHLLCFGIVLEDVLSKLLALAAKLYAMMNSYTSGTVSQNKLICTLFLV